MFYALAFPLLSDSGKTAAVRTGGAQTTRSSHGALCTPCYSLVSLQPLISSKGDQTPILLHHDMLLVHRLHGAEGKA